MPPTTQNNARKLCKGLKGTPAMISPELNKISFPDMHFFLVYKAIVTKSNVKAAIQNGTATFVKNKRGIPTIVIPTRLKRAIIPRQTLWQTCQEPSTLAAPDTLMIALGVIILIFFV